jgi:hypothetical protein
MRSGDWTGAAVDGLTMLTGGAVGKITKSMAEREFLRAGASTFRTKLGSELANYDAQQGLKIICLNVPSDQKITGFCLF